jgi:hypothetical protein
VRKEKQQMNTKTIVRVGTSGAAALAAANANALYTPYYQSTDVMMNLWQQDNGGASINIYGNDTNGWSYGHATPITGGVKAYLITQGGSGYMKGFARCQNGSTVSAVYTNAHATADGNSAVNAWCSWLGAGWTRVGYGAIISTLDTAPPGGWVTRPISKGIGDATGLTVRVKNPFLSYYNPLPNIPDWDNFHIYVPQLPNPHLPSCW